LLKNHLKILILLQRKAWFKKQFETDMNFGITFCVFSTTQQLFSNSSDVMNILVVFRNKISKGGKG